MPLPWRSLFDSGLSNCSGSGNLGMGAIVVTKKCQKDLFEVIRLLTAHTCKNLRKQLIAAGVLLV
jgi:hypothetical protein